MASLIASPEGGWQKLMDAYLHGDWERFESLAHSLLELLDCNELPPPKTAIHATKPAWDRFVVTATCRTALALSETRLEPAP